MQPFPADDTLGAWAAWWLDLRCGCGRSVLLPLRLLARRHGPATPLPGVTWRLRCRACGAAPAAAELVDDPQRDAPGYRAAAPARRRPVPRA